MILVNYPPLILHLGYPRTATTLLQLALEAHGSRIGFFGRKAAGRDEDRWRDGRLHAAWEWARRGGSAFDAEGARAVIDADLEQAARQGLASVVVSDETMCKPQRRDGHAGLAQRLHSLFPRARILLTLRNQVDLVASMYGKHLASTLGSDAPAPTFGQWLLMGGGSAYTPLADRFDYMSLYGALAERFGKESIHLLTFEEFKRDPAAYAARLAEILNCPGFDLQRGTLVNASPRLGEDLRLKRKLAPEALARLYRIKGLEPLFPLLDRLCLARANIPWEQYAPGEEGRRTIAQLFVDSNDRVAQASGLDLSSLGYPTSATMAPINDYYQT